MTTHIVLGTGAVGAALTRELAARGHRVTAVNRSGSRAGLPDRADLRAGDVRDRAFLADVIAGADVVHQVAQPAYHRWAEEFPALQSAVLDAAEAAGAAVVLADNLYCYGPPAGPLREDSPERPTTVKGRVRKEMADAALARHRAGRLRVALSRPSNYVGGGYEVTERLVFGPARTGGTMRFLGRADQPHSYSSPVDAARAMATIAEREAWGRAWLAPTLPPVTTAELAARVWSEAGRDGRPRVQTIRGLGLRLLGATSPLLRESVEMAYEVDAPFVVDSTAIARELGVTASSWDEVITDALAA